MEGKKEWKVVFSSSLGLLVGDAVITPGGEQISF